MEVEANDVGPSRRPAGNRGGYSAFVPGFPGCTSCGDTLEETLANIREAFEGVFEVMQSQDPEAGAKRRVVEL